MYLIFSAVFLKSVDWISFIPIQVFPPQMAQIKLKKDLEGLYKAKYALIFSFILTVLLSNRIIRIYKTALTMSIIFQLSFPMGPLS